MSRWDKYKTASPTSAAPAPTGGRWDKYRATTNTPTANAGAGAALPNSTAPLQSATSTLPNWVSPAVNAIPAVTSGLAGLAGGGEGPLAIGLAGAGGSAGELARELLAQQLGLSLS